MRDSISRYLYFAIQPCMSSLIPRLTGLNLGMRLMHVHIQWLLQYNFAIGHVGVLPLVTMFWQYFHHGYGSDYKSAFQRCYSATVPRLIAHVTKTTESQYIPH